MIRLGGFTPLTTIDFPGRLAAVLFLQGCPWRCSYCHNPDLLPARGSKEVDWRKMLSWLAHRRGLLDGVVFSGGEPTVQADLAAALVQVRAMEFQTALHTGGMYPWRLQQVLPLLDWVGLDVKAPPARHAEVVGRRDGNAAAEQALDLVLASGIAHECRTTWHPDLFSLGELHQLGKSLLQKGVRHWVIQACRIEGKPIPAHVWTDIAGWGEDLSFLSVRR
jgi:pyruvate formate lyase activating enzyme